MKTSTNQNELQTNQPTICNKRVYTSKSAPLVAKIRERFFENEWPKNAELYCEQDIERIKQSDWFVKRYLLQTKRNVDEAYDLLVQALRWRKEINFPNLSEKYFPKEFFEIGALFSYEPDRQGNPVIYLRVRVHRKIKDVELFVKLFLFYTINRVDLESGENGCTVVFDCNGAGYANMDLDLLKNLIDIAFKYFPYCIRLVIIHELSWMLDAFRRIAMTFVPATLKSIVKFTNKDNIDEYIAIENLPDFMGGKCQRNYRRIPDNCPTIEEACAEIGFSAEKAHKILKQFEPYLIESREAIKKIEEQQRQQQQQQQQQEQQKSSNQNQKKLTNGDVFLDEQQQQQSNKEALNINGDDKIIKNISEKNEHEAPSPSSTTATAATNANDEKIALVHSPKSKLYQQIATIYPQNIIQFRRRILYMNQLNHLNQNYLKKIFEPEKENFVHKKLNLSSSTSKSVVLTTGTIMIHNNNLNRILAFKIQSNCSCTLSSSSSSSTNNGVDDDDEKNDDNGDVDGNGNGKNCSYKYIVTPNQGLLLPESYIRINIILQPTNNVITGNIPNLIKNMMITKKTNKDKFLLIMCSLSKDYFNNQMYLKINRTQFNQLFDKINIDYDNHGDNSKQKIFTHKFIAKFDHINDDDVLLSDNLNESNQLSDGKSIILKLSNELRLLRKNYRKISKQQSMINSIVLIVILILMLVWILDLFPMFFNEQNNMVKYFD